MQDLENHFLILIIFIYLEKPVPLQTTKGFGLSTLRKYCFKANSCRQGDLAEITFSNQVFLITNWLIKSNDWTKLTAWILSVHLIFGTWSPAEYYPLIDI